MSLNNVILKGRMTGDITRRESNATVVGTFTIAVTRDKENTDFVNCVAFGKVAEYIEKYFKKGQEIIVQGAIRTNSYTDKNGEKRTSVSVVVFQTDFCGKIEKKEDKVDVTDAIISGEFAPADDLPF